MLTQSNRFSKYSYSCDCETCWWDRQYRSFGWDKRPFYREQATYEESKW